MSRRMSTSVYMIIFRCVKICVLKMKVLRQNTLRFQLYYIAQFHWYHWSLYFSQQCDLEQCNIGLKLQHNSRLEISQVTVNRFLKLPVVLKIIFQYIIYFYNTVRENLCWCELYVFCFFQVMLTRITRILPDLIQQILLLV